MQTERSPAGFVRHALIRAYDPPWERVGIHYMNNLANHTETKVLISPRPNRLWAAFLLGSLCAFGPLTIDMYLPALPILTDDFQTSTSLAQLSLTACMLGLSIGQLFAGPISDIQGRRRPLLVGLAVYFIVSVLCSLSPSIWAFVMLRFIQGAAASAGIVIARAVARDLYHGPELTKFYALLMLVNGAAPILAPVIGGQVLRITVWQGVFVILGLIGAAIFLAVLFGLQETLPAGKRSKGGIRNTVSTFRGLIGNREFMGYALAQGFSSAAMFAYISGSPFVLQNMFHVTPQMYSLFFAINAFGIITASQITGRLAGRVKESKLLLCGLSIATFGGITLLIAILAGGTLSFILPPLFLAVSSVGIINTSSFALAMQSQGHVAGSAAALLGLSSFILGALAAPLVGLAGSHTAVPMGIVIALAEICAFSCFAFLARRKEQ